MGVYGRSAYLAEVRMVALPVPRQAIPPYTLLKPEIFETRSFPQALAEFSYFSKVEELEGRISTARLSAGLPVPRELAVSTNEPRLAGDGWLALAVPSDQAQAILQVLAGVEAGRERLWASSAAP